MLEVNLPNFITVAIIAIIAMVIFQTAKRAIGGRGSKLPDMQGAQ